MVIIIGLPAAARGYTEMPNRKMFARFQPGNWDAGAGVWGRREMGESERDEMEEV